MASLLAHVQGARYPWRSLVHRFLELVAMVVLALVAQRCEGLAAVIGVLLRVLRLVLLRLEVRSLIGVLDDAYLAMIVALHEALSDEPVDLRLNVIRDPDLVLHGSQLRLQCVVLLQLLLHLQLV